MYMVDTAARPIVSYRQHKKGERAMPKGIVRHLATLTGKTREEHLHYTYTKKKVVGRSEAEKCVVSVYEVAPGKAAYPYHYHKNNEEVFYILQGEGLLQTPQGEQPVCAGDFLFFPAGEDGAHMLTNTSKTQTLAYIDFDTKSEPDVCVYPHSQKIAVWGSGVNRVFRLQDSVDYYAGEEK